MLDLLTPYLPALAGGLLIGLAAGGFYLLDGRLAGISGIARSALSGTPHSRWRWAFLAGLVAAGGLHLLMGGGPSVMLVALRWEVLAVAGLVVGLGAGIGSGCTSGHGICGLSRLSPRSLAAVAIFMTTASVTVYVVRHVLAGGA